MKNNYQKRKTFTIKLLDLPFESDNKLHIDNWEDLLVKFPSTLMPVDIGVLCYLKRKKISTNTFEFPVHLVVKSSIQKVRVKRIKKFLEDIYFDAKIKNKNGRTISSIFGHFKRFIDWCDSNKFSNCLKNSSKAKNALTAYGYEQQHLYQSNIQSTKTSSVYYNSAITIVATILNKHVYQINQGLPQIYVPTSNEGTEPVSDNKMEVYQEHCKMIFRGIFDLIINKKNYPFKLNLPNESVWVFPTPKPFYTKRDIIKERNKNDIMKVYNFTEGKIYSLEEISSFYPTKDIANRARRVALKNLDEANFNFNSHYRVILATFAVQSFISYLLSIVPINLSVLRNIMWNSKMYNLKSKNFKMKGIKARANYKEVEYIIPNFLRKDFKKYLIMRQFLIDSNSREQTPNTLFFGFKIKLPGEYDFYKLNKNFSNKFNIRLKRLLGGKVPLLTSRQFRATIAENLINKVGPLQTAQVLQNSIETTLNHYNSGTEKRTSVEMSRYFNEINSQILVKNIDTNTETPAGQCISYGNPESFVKKSEIEANCNQFEGCLFCKKYKIIANDEGIRNLISLKYVIFQTKHLSVSFLHFKQVFGELIERIDAFISLVSNRSDELNETVNKINAEINNEELLSKYWEHKLKFLIDLGVA